MYFTLLKNGLDSLIAGKNFIVCIVKRHIYSAKLTIFLSHLNRKKIELLRINLHNNLRIEREELFCDYLPFVWGERGRVCC
jgi:hypothetical protein